MAGVAVGVPVNMPRSYDLLVQHKQPVFLESRLMQKCLVRFQECLLCSIAASLSVTCINLAPCPCCLRVMHCLLFLLCLGFLAGASAEIFGAGPLLLQLSKYPQPVLAVLALITAGSIIPVVKGTEGGYLKSLRETYTLPEGE